MEQKKTFEQSPMTLMSDQLTVCGDYQRRLDMGRVKRIAKSYDPNVTSPVKVSARDGMYYIIDGQHTVAVQEYLNGGNPVEIRCVVYYGMTQQDEAQLFVAQTGYSVPVNARDKLWAMWNNGDPEAVDMVNRVKAAGLNVTMKYTTDAHGTISAVNTLWGAYHSLGADTFQRMLKTLGATWGGDVASLQGKIIGGMAQIYRLYLAELDERKFITKLRNVSPATIIRDGRILANGYKGYALAMLRAYNKGCRKKLDESALMK